MGCTHCMKCSTCIHVAVNFVISFCCVWVKALRINPKNWLAQNLDNVSEWTDMSACGLLFQ